MIRLLRDIVETYGFPRRVMARKLATPPGERILLGYVMMASLLYFIFRAPRQVAQFVPDETSPLEAFIAAQFVVALIFLPLTFYAFAAIARLVAKPLGGSGSWQGQRLALFWAFVTIQPIVLLIEIAAKYGLSGGWLQSCLIFMGFLFLWIWISAAFQSEQRSK